MGWDICVLLSVPIYFILYLNVPKMNGLCRYLHLFIPCKTQTFAIVSLVFRHHDSHSKSNYQLCWTIRSLCVLCSQSEFQIHTFFLLFLLQISTHGCCLLKYWNTKLRAPTRSYQSLASKPFLWNSSNQCYCLKIRTLSVELRRTLE